MNSCALWGDAANQPADSDPNCACTMCQARRYDKLPKNTKGHARDRMRPRPHQSKRGDEAVASIG